MNKEKLKKINNVLLLNEKLLNLQEKKYKVATKEDFNFFKKEIIENKNFLFFAFLIDNIDERKLKLEEEVDELDIMDLLYGNHLLNILYKNALKDIKNVISLYSQVNNIIYINKINYKDIEVFKKIEEELVKMYVDFVKNLGFSEDKHEAAQKTYFLYMDLPEYQENIKQIINELNIQEKIDYNFDNKFKIIV
jgi:MoaA/NifB/PqqE/SkfB family radical SAM enzyme